jgi:hypothetical protein
MTDKNINIYQIYYLAEQLNRLDEAFVPYDNSKPPYTAEESNRLREWPIIRTYGAERAKRDNSDVWGFVSYKFQEKTNTTGQQFVDFIKNNPDNDVWFMEPEYVNNPFFNPWTQGDIYHPNVSQIPNALFKRDGQPLDVTKIPMSFCWYNFFAGTSKFWNQYFRTMDAIIEASKKSQNLDQILFHTGAGHGNDPTVPYFIFVVERMFPTLLALSNLKSVGLKYKHADFIFR